VVPSPECGAADDADEKADSSSAVEENEADRDLGSISTARKLALLALFSSAQFLEVFNNSALFPAIPNIRSDLQFDSSETVWIISAYQLTFAAFLLLVRAKDLSPSPTDGHARADGYPTFIQQSQLLLRELSFLESPISSVALPTRRLPSLYSER